MRRVPRSSTGVRRTRRHAWLLSVLIAAIATSASVAAALAGTSDGVRVRMSDGLWPNGSQDPRVRVVGIDAAAMDAAADPWPWPRATQAELVRALTRAGAAVIVLDFVYSPARAGDDDLAAAFAEHGRVVLASSTSRLAPSTVKVGHTRLLKAADRSAAVELASRAALTSGTAALLTDKDGIVRRVPALVERPDGELEPALSVAAVDAFDGKVQPAIVRDRSVRAGDLDIPVSSVAGLRIGWAGQLLDPATATSAKDVLAGSIEPDSWKGSIVFVGVTDPALGDRHVVPGAPAALPGVFVHAQAANTMLTGAWVREAPLPPTTALTFVPSLFVALVALRLRLRWLAPALAVSLLTLAGVSVLAFLGPGWLPDLARPPAAVVFAAAAATAVRALTEGRERRRVGALFQRYVPEQVARQLVEEQLVEVAGAGQRVDVGLLFCDLRGFTPMAATMDPGRVREVLERFYEHVCGEVFRRDGTVMQFVGDEVFAVFGAPLPREDGADAAIDCAIAVQANAGMLIDDLAARGLPGVSFGISVHAGPVVAAHVGTDRRRQYAVVGDAVNVGSRLCGSAAAGEVVVSGVAATRAGRNFDRGGADSVPLKGIVGPVAIHRLQPAPLTD